MCMQKSVIMWFGCLPMLVTLQHSMDHVQQDIVKEKFPSKDFKIKV